MKNNEIGVVLTVPGFHFWSSAPEEVSFLRNNHRHLFRIEAVFEVNHNDRDLEFFLMQRAIHKHLSLVYDRNEDGIQFGGNSCESIAQELVNTFGLLWCKVTEDNESWGKAYPKQQ